MILTERDVFVIGVATGRETTPLVFRLPGIMEKRGYHQTISFTYFFQNPHKFRGQDRKTIDPHTKIRYIARMMPDVSEHEIDMNIRRQGPPVVRVRDIFAFYECVGFDRTKRRWLTLSERGLVVP